MGKMVLQKSFSWKIELILAKQLDVPQHLGSNFLTTFQAMLRKPWMRP